MKMINLLTAFFMGLILSCLAVACSGGHDDGTTADNGPVEKSLLHVGFSPHIDAAPLYLAIERGLFAAEGLNVVLVGGPDRVDGPTDTDLVAGAAGVDRGDRTSNGSASIADLQQGDIDIVFATYPSALRAVQAGVPLVVAQEASRSGKLSAGLYARSRSGIDTPADLAGATIAVDVLNDIVQLALEAQLADVGLSFDDVTLVELEPADMVTALGLGRVDVIATVEPFGTVAADTIEAHLVVDLFRGPLSDFPLTGWHTTRAFVDDNPNTIAAFNRAIATAAVAVANDDRALATTVSAFTAIEPGLADQLNYPRIVSGLDIKRVQSVSDLMADQGLLDDPIDVADHVVP